MSKKHHRKTCFRCQLRKLLIKMHPKGMRQDDGRFALAAMAELSGFLLVPLKESDKAAFIARLDQSIEEGKAMMQAMLSTRH
jgi:hypothetical protein